MGVQDVAAVQRWLHGARRRTRERREGGPPGAADDAVEEGLAGLEALVAAGALTQAEAKPWRAALQGPPAPAAPADLARHAEATLSALLARVPAGPGHDDVALERFEGALNLLSAIGAVDAAAWDARLRERAGWPSDEEERAVELALNAGGTQAELVAILPGPAEPRGGFRLAL